jgi:hypothetical protein
LAQGLAWRREDRSISVGEWLEQLRPAAGAGRWASTHNIALAAALVVGLGFGALFNRQLSERRAGTNATVSQIASIVPEAAAPMATGAAENRSEAPQAQSPPSSPSLSQASSQPQPQASPQPPSQPSSQPQASQRSARSTAAEPPETLSIAAASYQIGARRNFAEIHVRRSNGSGGSTNFAWWTEAASALPGTDYVPQAQTIQVLSARSQMASLFVKLVPNVSRKHPAVFHVVIAEPGNGASLGRITRASVVLPPR